jgi:hypothetical protein
MSQGRKAAFELGITIGAPTAVLWGLSDRLGAAPALMLALAFPVGWILWKAVQTRKIDKFALVVLFGLSVTGGVGLLHLDARWVAAKELLIPGLFATAMVGSVAAGAPALGPILDQLLDRDATQAALKEAHAEAGWASALVGATLQLAAILVLSGIAQAILTWWMLDAPPGSEEFNADLGRTNTIGFIAVTLPTLALSVLPLQRLLDRLEALTGVPLDKLMSSAS